MLIAFGASTIALVPRAALAQAADVPYVPTPMNVVEAMLDIAKVGPQDFVIDLGSGDGRIVITAAKKYGASGFGVDLDGALVAEAKREAQREGVAGRVDFYARNLFITDIDKATVLTSYLLPQVNMELRPRLFAELKPGTRVVTHEFDFGNWKPDAHRRVAVPDKRYGPPYSDVYLWIVPANVAGTWRWRAPAGVEGVDCEVKLDQTFQSLRGSAHVAGRPARVESAAISGEHVALALVLEIDGRQVRQELNGRVEGDAIRGRVRTTGQGDSVETEWVATRTLRGKINTDA
jgi:hypothetical protein